MAAHHGPVTDVPPESRPEPPPDPDHTRVLPPDEQPRPQRPAFKDRLWSLRAVIAVALASVILGGLGGAAIAAAGDDHDGRDKMMRFHRGGGPGGPMGQQPGWQGRRDGQWPMPHVRPRRPWDQDTRPLLPPNRAPSPAPPKASPSP
jgi:hypothetical protein